MRKTAPFPVNASAIQHKILRLIRKWLRAGVMEPDASMIHPETGTPQGGIISPILANVYLHYALDLWFEHIFKAKCRGRAKLVRYVDDLVAVFQYHDEATAFLKVLENRLGKFRLSLAPEKTRKFRFSRFAIGGESFDFLGFTFRWGTNRKGGPQVWRETSRKRFREALRRLKDWIRKARRYQIRELMMTLKSKYRGHRKYYGVIGNSRRVGTFEFFGHGIIFKWLNRRSQRKSYTWEGFKVMLRQFGISGGSEEKMAA